MRDILFRGKAINRDRGEYRTDYKNGDWVYGLLMKKYDERFENLPAEMSNEDGVTGIEVDYKTIGEYTGLTDTSGKKIFEGDIVVNDLSQMRDALSNKPHVVKFINGRWNYICDEGRKVKIIGNIYDNLELLKMDGGQL